MARILVVDDDVDFQVIMRRMLEAEGYEVSIAENGNQALEMVRRGQMPDVILLDVMMATTLEGVAVAREIKGDAALEDVPIIMVSSIATSPEAAEFPEYEHIPIDGWLSKPVQRDVLLKTLERFLSQGSEEAF
ncbi:MAG: response regulator [Anaerolineae bacterium]|jgi:CheY-like chemotaxis protein|nr:response regulator [Anaerolineae bacterium]